MSYRLHATRWPWFVAAVVLPLAWHAVDSVIHPQRQVPIQRAVKGAPCVEEVALTNTLGLMSAPIPRTPADAWKRPPCEYPEVEISGACWVLPAQEDGGIPKLPCPPGLWEARGKCWKPVGRAKREPQTLGR